MLVIANHLVQQFPISMHNTLNFIANTFKGAYYLYSVRTCDVDKISDLLQAKNSRTHFTNQLIAFCTVPLVAPPAVLWPLLDFDLANSSLAPR